MDEKERHLLCVKIFARKVELFAKDYQNDLERAKYVADKFGATKEEIKAAEAAGKEAV